MVHNGFHTAGDLSQHCKGLPCHMFKVVLGIDNADADVLGDELTKTVWHGRIQVNTYNVVE